MTGGRSGSTLPQPPMSCSDDDPLDHIGRGLGALVAAGGLSVASRIPRGETPLQSWPGAPDRTPEAKLRDRKIGRSAPPWQRWDRKRIGRSSTRISRMARKR